MLPGTVSVSVVPETESPEVQELPFQDKTAPTTARLESPNWYRPVASQFVADEQATAEIE